MTISLSNMSPNNKKVISIKKIAEINQKPNGLSNNSEDHQSVLQTEIDALHVEINALQQQKHKLLTDLKQAIERERTAWLEQKEKEKNEAQKVGYKVGYDAGYEQAQQEYESTLNEANNIVKAAKQDYDKLLAKHEGTIAQLAVTIAKKILNDQLAIHPDQIGSIISHALEDLKESSDVAIYLHPDDYKVVSKQKAELEQFLREEDVLTLYVNTQLHKGDCLIKHAYGQIDVGIDSQLQQIKLALEEKISEN